MPWLDQFVDPRKPFVGTYVLSARGSEESCANMFGSLELEERTARLLILAQLEGLMILDGSEVRMYFTVRRTFTYKAVDIAH